MRQGWIRAMRNAVFGALAGGGAALALAGADVEGALTVDPAAAAQYPATVVELTIDSAGSRLPAHLYIAAGAGPHPTVVMLHGIPGNERNLDLAQALRRFGFNALFFHYRGAWGAEGDYTVLGQLDDVDAVIAHLTTPENAAALRVDPRSLSLLGHSLGGFGALASGARRDDLSCVVALSPANMGLWKAALDAPDNDGLADLVGYADALFMLRGLSSQSFRTELEAAPMAALDTRGFGAGLRGKAVLLLVGDRDAVTPAASMLEPVAAAYREVPGLDVTARILPGDHSFSASRLALTREILAWMDDRCR